MGWWSSVLSDFWGSSKMTRSGRILTDECDSEWLIDRLVITAPVISNVWSSSDLTWISCLLPVRVILHCWQSGDILVTLASDIWCGLNDYQIRPFIDRQAWLPSWEQPGDVAIALVSGLWCSLKISGSGYSLTGKRDSQVGDNLVTYLLHWCQTYDVV